MERKIKKAMADYTGGGVYIYYGELSDGTYFRTSDGEDFIEICDADTSVDEADYYEFYEKHSIETLTDKEYEVFWNMVLLWIIHNAPTGNYQINDLENRLLPNELYLLKISYSWGDEEPDKEFSSFEEAWEEAKQMALSESETVSEEHDCEIGLVFDKEQGAIRLHYTYDDEWCYYDVVKW